MKNREQYLDETIQHICLALRATAVKVCKDDSHDYLIAMLFEIRKILPESSNMSVDEILIALVGQAQSRGKYE